MKRAATTTEAATDKGKKARGNLAFLGTCISTARLLSDGVAWKAAKAAAAAGDVIVTCIKEDSSTSTLCMQGRVTAPPRGSKVAAAAHAHPFPGQAQVQLLVDTRSGELLDADTSCCPGGYHAARGSFCPCVGALLLAAAQLQSLEHGEHQELALPHWMGTDVVTAQRHTTHKAGKLQQLVQPGLLHQAPAQLLQPAAEVRVLPSVQTQAKLQQDHHPHFERVTGNADTIDTLVREELEDWEEPAILADEPCDLPVEDKHNASEELPAVRPATGTSAAAAADRFEDSGPAGVGRQDQAQLLAALGGAHLTSYMGSVVPGWEQRPKVINWAFRLLQQAAAKGHPHSRPAACSSSLAVAGVTTNNAEPLVAVTGLLRVLWHLVCVEGLPLELRGVLLVAMALRNLLLVVALPVWARKAVAAQLRAWQEGMSSAQACTPTNYDGNVKLVHLLRVLKEAEQLCHHGWDHPSFSAALEPTSSHPTSPSQAKEVHHPAIISQLALVEEPGLVLLRLAYLEMLGQQAAYLNLAIAGKQWNHAVSALLRSGNRSHLRLAAELLPRHITSLPQRLDYTIQLLGAEQLPVVERCELAARLLLSLREDLLPHVLQPCAGNDGWAFWKVQLWQMPTNVDGDNEAVGLQAQLAVFFKEFLTLAGQAQFDLAKKSIASPDGPAGPAAAAFGVAADHNTAEPAGPPSSAAAAPHYLGVDPDVALQQLQALPLELWWPVMFALQEGIKDVEKLDDQTRTKLKEKWGVRLQSTWEQLVACHTWPSGVPGEHAPGGIPPSPTSPLELDKAMLHYGEPSHRYLNNNPARLQLDSMGFVEGPISNDKGPIDGGKVEPFPLPNLLPICGLAPAALHALLEGALAPLVDTTFRPKIINGDVTLASSRPGDLGSTLLQVAGHPGVEYGGAAVRLQMAVEMVAYAAALTPLDDGQGHNSMLVEVYQQVLYGLLAMGQQDLAWMAARAAYRAVPGRFTATYLLLLGIQRGYKAQAAAVDWILGKDWPQAAGDAQTLDGNPADAPGGSGCNPASRDGDETSSMDTQQLLGHDAAEAIHLADTATSSSNPPATQVQRQPAAQPDVPAAQQPAPVAPAGDAALDSGDLLSARVWLTLRAFVAACQAHKAEACWPDALGALAVTTGLPPADLGNMLDTLQKALDTGYIEYPAVDDDGDLFNYELDPPEAAMEQAVRMMNRMARARGLPQVATQDAGGDFAELLQGQPAATEATIALEQEMLDVTGPNWLKRVGMLQELGLQPVIQFTAACGLHPDLVTRLGLVYIEGQLEESATPPVTWDVWLAVARKGRGLESFVSRALPTPPQGDFVATAVVLAVPGISIKPAACEYGDTTLLDVRAGFNQWLLYWLEQDTQGVTTSGGSASSSNGTIGNGSNSSMLPGHVTDHSTGSSTHNIAPAPGMSRAASLLRKLWLHLRRYSTWMLWVAAALNRSGEQQLACQAAAQGLLPVSCHFWNIKGIDKASAACFEALLPVLAQSGNPAILQQAAATQLFMVQAPVPVEILLKEGVMKHLLELTTQLATCCTPDAQQATLQVPSSCMNPVTGRAFPTSMFMLACPFTNGNTMAAPLLTDLLQRCVFGPLAVYLHSSPSTADGKQPALRSVSSLGEALVIAAFKQALSELHWSMGLWMVRMAREAGVICSWPGLVRALKGPLAAAVDVSMLAVSQSGAPSYTTIEEWAKHRRNTRWMPPFTLWKTEPGSWVNGILTWVARELGVHNQAAEGGPAAQPPPECVEELSACLLGFRSPHVVLYAASAIQALQGRSPAHLTSTLIPNGVLPLVGRPEDLQACMVNGTMNLSPYWAWSQPCYTQALQRLLQQRQLLASLPPATIKNMALTYWVKCGTLEAMAWVGQLLDWAQQRSAPTSLHSAAGSGDLETADAGMEAGPLLPGPLQVVTPGYLLSIQVHPELAPFLDLTPPPLGQATMLRFAQLQTAAHRQDVLGALAVLFKEPPEALAPGTPLTALQCSDLEQRFLELVNMQNFLQQQPYADAPAIRWLREQPQYHHLWQVLPGAPAPSVLDTSLAALNSPQLQLRVLQYKLRMLSNVILQAPPGITERISRGPAKPWQEQLTGLQCASAEPYYILCADKWAQLADADLDAAFLAARTFVPGPVPLPRPQMVSTVLGCFQVQEVALAWAVVKYAELRGPYEELLDDLRALVLEPAQLGQLPVFMAHLGAAVKQERSHYPLYAMFRPVRVPKSVHDYVWGSGCVDSVSQLRRYLNKSSRLELQQLMVQVMPWLDWQGGSKDAEARALAEWLWWLAGDDQQRGVVQVEAATDVEAQVNEPDPWAHVTSSDEEDEDWKPSGGR